MSMDWTLVINLPLAVLPGLGWLALFAWWHRADREMIRRLARVFVLGCVMCVPAGEVNAALRQSLGVDDRVTLALALVLVAGPGEEILKFLIVWSEVFRRWRFRSERDGIVFAAASGLGFAAYENAAAMQDLGMSVLAARGWACSLAHVACSAVFGYYLGLAKARRYRTGACVGEGLVLAGLLHGAYDLAVALDDRCVFPAAFVLASIAAATLRGGSGPLIARIAPLRAAAPARPAASAGYQRRRFPLASKAPAVARVNAALDAMDSIEEDARRRAIPEALEFLDQRLFEKVAQLTHDPVDAVRADAIKAHKEMKRRLLRRE